MTYAYFLFVGFVLLCVLCRLVGESSVEISFMVDRGRTLAFRVASESLRPRYIEVGS